jgi:hypothetical protein
MPFGNNRYNRLPIGILQSPDIAQEIREDIFQQFHKVDVNIDNIGVFSSAWQLHCDSMYKILDLLQRNNLLTL